MKKNIFEQIFELDDRQLPIGFYKNPRARNLTLRIETGGKALRVSMPPKISITEALRFVEAHRAWLTHKLQHLPPPQNHPMLRVGTFIPIFGKPHLIEHEKGRGLTHIVEAIEAQAAKIIVYGSEETIPRHIARFLKKQAHLIIAPLVAKHSGKIGKKATSIRFKDTKSRWGSCSSMGNLSFSWRIIMAPKAVIDYLVAHEVAHLREMNHGPQFWALCESLCPNYKTMQAWLKRNGQALHAIDFS